MAIPGAPPRLLVILMNPTSALDPILRRRHHERCCAVCRKLGSALLLVTHHRGLAAAATERRSPCVPVASSGPQAAPQRAGVDRRLRNDPPKGRVQRPPIIDARDVRRCWARPIP